MKKRKLFLLSLLTLLTSCGHNANNGIKKAGKLTNSSTSSLKINISFSGTNYSFDANGFVAVNNAKHDISYSISKKKWTLVHEYIIETDTSVADYYDVAKLEELDCTKIHPSYTNKHVAYFIRLSNDYDDTDSGLYAFNVSDVDITLDNVVNNFENKSVTLTQTK